MLTPTTNTGPHWLAVASAALSGWNLGVLIGFSVLGLAERFPLVSGQTGVVLTMWIAIICGIAVGTFGGHRLVKPLLSLTRFKAYLLHAGLLALTALTFPGVFRYTF